MKNMKKFASILLALVLAMALTVPALADDNPGSISITNATKGNTYNAYLLFELESYNTESEAYAYKYNKSTDTVTNPWDEFILGSVGKQYVSVDTQGYVTWVEGADAAAFAKAAIDYLKQVNSDTSADNNISVAGSVTANGENEEQSVTITNLALGYYLVDSSLGALCALDTTQPNVSVTEKNSKPSVTKEVQEDSLVNGPGSGWQSANDAQIGQVVNYKSTVTVGKGAENYILHDKMSKGLTFNTDSVSITLDGNTVATSNYTVNTNPTDECTFEITFDNTYMSGLAQGKQLIVTYSATLNKDAEIYTIANTNETWLKYGDDSATDNETPHNTTKTYTYAFDLIKTDKATGERLAGATFQLYDAKTNGNLIPLVSEGNNVYRIATSTSEEGASTEKFTVPADGKVVIKGIDADDIYYLEEVDAPAGYNKLAERVEVKLTREFNDTNNDVTNVVTLNNATVGDAVNGKTPWTGCINVENSTGAEMPETGGIGTTIFYTLGGLMVVAAGVLLVTKRRMHSNG